MPVLDEAETIERTAITETQRYELNQIFWLWFEDHRDDKVVSIGILFIRTTVRVHHLRPLFSLLFGDRG